MNDGGPAFPNPGLDAEPAQGMSLRAVLVGQALNGLCASTFGRTMISGMDSRGNGRVGLNLRQLAGAAVAVADRTLEELENTENKEDGQ